MRSELIAAVLGGAIGATGAQVVRTFGQPSDEHLVYDSSELVGDRVKWIDAEGNVVLSTGQITGIKGLLTVHGNDISWLIQQVGELHARLDACGCDK